ncbi:MAG TPA: hypothetical protein VHG33_02155 [Woeseiaceae bacterium]|nr:hypothetical protein [Woeseiaceae bacterium]
MPFLSGNDRRAGADLPCILRYRTHRHDRVKGAGRAALQQVKEDPEFYVPDLLSDDDYELDVHAWSAADAHAKHLRKAEGWLHDAQNLSRVLRASVQDGADSRAAQADTVLKIIEKRLRKASRAIDRHGRRHSNLFLAYVELRQERERPGSK